MMNFIQVIADMIAFYHVLALADHSSIPFLFCFRSLVFVAFVVLILHLAFFFFFTSVCLFHTV